MMCRKQRSSVTQRMQLRQYLHVVWKGLISVWNVPCSISHVAKKSRSASGRSVKRREILSALRRIARSG